MPIFSSLEASDNKLWKNVTNSAENPLVDLPPPCKTRLLRNCGHSFVLHQIRTERFKYCFINRCPFNLSIAIVNCNPECLFLESINSLFIFYLFILTLN